MYFEIDKLVCTNSNLAFLSNDPEVMKIKESLKDFSPIPFSAAVEGQQSRPIRIYLEGIFDLFHYGHANLFLQAKNYFPGPVWVVVGIPCDTDTIKNKKRTVMRSDERILSIRHCRHVDEVIVDCPWVTTIEFLDENKLDFIMHDPTPYPSAGMKDIYEEFKNIGRFLPSRRTINISTSDIINTIEKRLETFEIN